MERINNFIPYIKDYYYINKNGEVYSLAKEKPVIVKGKTDKDGYIEYGLYQKNDKRKYLRAHRVMGAVYLGLDLTTKYEINHKNGIKNDNKLSNLEIVTSSENKIHAIKKLKVDYSKNLPDNKRPVEMFNVNTQKIERYESIKSMCDDNNFCYDFLVNKLKKNNGSTLYREFQIKYIK